MHSSGYVMFSTHRQDVRHRFGRRFRAGRGAILTAHTGRQVVRADEDSVDAGHGKNLVGALNGRDVFALQYDQQLVVGVPEILVRCGIEVERMGRAAD